MKACSGLRRREKKARDLVKARNIAEGLGGEAAFVVQMRSNCYVGHIVKLRSAIRTILPFI
jgi:hypothetical protein